MQVQGHRKNRDHEWKQILIPNGKTRLLLCWRVVKAHRSGGIGSGESPHTLVQKEGSLNLIKGASLIIAGAGLENNCQRSHQK